MICTYECTFCKECVDKTLENICPNCGGGFCSRPNRPANHLKNDNYFETNPASIKITHKSANIEKYQNFIPSINGMAPHKR